MGSHYLGPENPKPFALISENYQHSLNIPDYPQEDQYRFGSVYEEAMFSLIHTHLELGTTDRFCYVGETKGSFAPLTERKFCLINPAKVVSPGLTLPNGSDSAQKMITLGPKTEGSIVEDYFRTSASQCSTYSKHMFDRVLIKDCIHLLNNKSCNLFTQVKTCLNPEGKLLIIHRPGMLNTLPLPRYMVQKFENQDIDIGPILNSLQDAGYDVKWDIETLPIVMPKVKWLSMIQEKYPADLEMCDDVDIRSAVRDLTEGMFKYEGDIVQFTDRLLFISASPTLRDQPPSIARYGSSGYREPPTITPEDLRYEMKVTEDIQTILDAKRRAAARKPNVGRTKAIW